MKGDRTGRNSIKREREVEKSVKCEEEQENGILVLTKSCACTCICTYKLRRNSQSETETESGTPLLSHTPPLHHPLSIELKPSLVLYLISLKCNTHLNNYELSLYIYISLSISISALTQSIKLNFKTQVHSLTTHLPQTTPPAFSILHYPKI